MNNNNNNNSNSDSNTNQQINITIVVMTVIIPTEEAPSIAVVRRPWATAYPPLLLL